MSQEYVDTKVQEEASARQAADEALRADIPTKTSQLSNDSGFLTEHQSLSDYYTKTEVDGKITDVVDRIPTRNSQLENDSGFLTVSDTIDTANRANNVDWTGVESKPTTVSGYGITDAATIEYVDS